MSASGLSSSLRRLATGETTVPPKAQRAAGPVEPLREAQPTRPGASKPASPRPAPVAVAAAPTPRNAPPAVRKPAPRAAFSPPAHQKNRRTAAVALFIGATLTLLPALWGVLFLMDVPVFEKARQDPDAAWAMAVLMLVACTTVSGLLYAGGAWYWVRSSAKR